MSWPAREVEEPLVDLRLAADVERGGGFVEDEHAGTGTHGEQRPRQGEPLPLAAGQLRAVVNARLNGVAQPPGSRSTTSIAPASSAACVTASASSR